MRHALPGILLYSRLAMAFIIMFVSPAPEQNTTMVIVLMYAGILSDVFDGILARKLQAANDTFRIMDTVIDLVFYLSIVFFISKVSPASLSENLVPVCAIFTLEFLMYTVSLIRFRQLPSPHALLSKLWGIVLVVEFTLLLLDVKGIHFQLALMFGLIAHADRLLIYCLLKTWNRDIPSSYHAFLLRQGKPIIRWKLFNS
jgi:CDP-diacylglycerol--glycerol-3-phosphate 3-phosphatidyltransferase